MKSDIIYSPVITEKTTALREQNVYVFKVAKDANKIQIKDAIESTFNVKVVSVNTLNTKSKKKRVVKNYGFRKTYKRARVKLADGSSIEM